MSENQPFEYVPLDLVDSNPWSCRLSEDPEHVKKVAVSIATEGLMQFPIGRKIDGRVQLAFGHTRLAAFRLLTHTNNPGFGMMPVIIRDLTDDEMFRTGVSENLARKDLTPIEEATAMKRYGDEFNKTSAEVGVLFNLSDSAVRNKVRLLQLPEDIRQKLMDSKISEGAARALLELFDLPEDLRQTSEKYYYSAQYKPSQIIFNAIHGATAESIRSDISELINRNSKDLAKATWKWDEIFTGNEHLVGACKGCAFLVKTGNKSLCLREDCFAVKEKLMKQRYLEQASLLAGIPILEGDTSITKFEYNNKPALELGKSVKCPNLRLIYDEYTYRTDDSHDHLKELGFPRAQIVCGKQQQWCSCCQAVIAGLEDMLVEKAASADKVAEPEYVPVADSEDPGEVVITVSIPVTLDQLKEVSRAARQQKKQNLLDIQAMQEDAAKVLADGLVNTGNPRIWLVILDDLNWSAANKIKEESKEDYSDDPIAWCNEIRYLIGQALVQKKCSENYYSSDPNPKMSLKRLNDFLQKAGLQELEYAVSAETEAV